MEEESEEEEEGVFWGEYHTLDHAGITIEAKALIFHITRTLHLFLQSKHRS